MQNCKGGEMSDGITDAVSYDQRAFDDWKRREIISFLSKMSKKELVDELAKREGVVHHIVNADQKWYLCIDHIEIGYERLCYAGGDTGAARILVVKE
jgi:hypothetical protein